MSHKKVIIPLFLLSNIVFSESTQVDSANWKQYIRAGIVQVSQEHDSAQQLLGIGGAIALLRWKMD